MALDSRMILEGIQPAIAAARPVTNLLQGAQSSQQLLRGDLQNQLLQQQAEQQQNLAPLQQRALEQGLTQGDLQTQILQANLNALGVPDVPTAKELALTTAKVAALPTTEARIAALQNIRQNAIQQGRTTENVDELLSAYSQSPGTGDQLLGAGIQAFERAGFLTPEQRQGAATFQKGDGGLVFDPNSGTFSIDPIAKARFDELEQKKNSVGLDAKDRQSINKDITSLIKDTVSIRNTAQDLEKLSEVGGGPSAIAMVFKFMKALDPTSVVREGEFALAEQAAGVDARVLNIYNKLANGERLGSEQIREFVDTAKTLANSSIDSSTEEANKYLSTFEDTIPRGFSDKVKARIPKLFDVKSQKVDSVNTEKQTRLEELRKRTGL